MRRLIQIFIAIVFFVGGIGLFIFYFPHIWGQELFPYPYREIYEEAWRQQESKGCNMPLRLNAAVGYVESGHNPQAVSRSGARGVMQLMPTTALGLARQKGIANFSPDQSFDPKTNIELGTDLLCRNIIAAEGDYEEAFARYNFGGRAENRANWPRETQGYVRKVKSVLDAYNSIYGSTSAGPVKPFKVEQPKSFISVISVKNLLNLLGGKQ